MALLEVQQLTTRFYTRNGISTAVEDVSFAVDQGEILGIVGESGSGKSVCCYSILGLLPCPPARIESGRALFANMDLLTASERELRAVRGNDIAMIFQDPMTSLNPYLSIGEQLIEPLLIHQNIARADARARGIELLEEVGIRRAEHRFDSFPHEFSGGMRQRVMIAMALISEPKLLIADEPTTALDVSIQAQILQLLLELQARRNIAVIFISHDLAVVRGVANKVIVMKEGQIVESGNSADLFECAQHPYTQKLLAAIPRGAKQATPIKQQEVLLRADNVVTSFYDRVHRRRFNAVDDVSFEHYRGEILGLVGESGSGKSTLGRSILQLVRPDAGSVVFDDISLTDKKPRELLPLRRRMQMIFQDPYASLNPRMTVFDTLAEPMLYHGQASPGNVHEQVLALMDDIGLERRFIRKYPHEFSGGQRQRIAIGRAIATQPEYIVADEPVSALDVTIQKQILELLLALVEKHNLTMLFISHDLAVVRQLCDRVMVMQGGKLLETGETEKLWQQPGHDYTRSLLASVPRH